VEYTENSRRQLFGII